MNDDHTACGGFMFGSEALTDTRRAIRQWMAAVCGHDAHDEHHTQGVRDRDARNVPGTMHALLLLQLFYEVGPLCL